MKTFTMIVVSLFFAPVIIAQQDAKKVLPFKYEELSSTEFVKAVEKSGGVCIIPFGILEKHATHLPLGSDLFEAREFAFSAAKKEYAVVFPPYYMGQVNCARHEPGTVAYSTDLIMKLLEETCEELARNGLKKIVFVNGHGGNNFFLRFFCQAQLHSKRDYITVVYEQGADAEMDKEIKALRKAKVDGHAGEEETSMMSVIRPDLVNKSAINEQSGLDQKHLEKLPFGFTGIWWYASFPNHYKADVAEPNLKLGEALIEKNGKQVAELIRYLKNNNSIEDLQNEFFKMAENPLQKK
jgi:creatinine amidohydrolase